mmetsp:Transcript_117622/g.344411  ORF Transcript_117622/g.344411 Transcript_117622/m.344411 type:complete len:212 (-) Transcript_117622:999-1634(-)
MAAGSSVIPSMCSDFSNWATDMRPSPSRSASVKCLCKSLSMSSRARRAQTRNSGKRMPGSSFQLVACERSRGPLATCGPRKRTRVPPSCGGLSSAKPERATLASSSKSRRAALISSSRKPSAAVQAARNRAKCWAPTSSSPSRPTALSASPIALRRAVTPSLCIKLWSLVLLTQPELADEASLVKAARTSACSCLANRSANSVKSAKSSVE